MEADECAAGIIPWASKLTAPHYAFDAKDVCRYSHTKSVVPSKGSTARGSLSDGSGGGPSLLHVATDKRLRGTDSYVSNSHLQFHTVPPPPLSSEEHERLTEAELRWIGSLPGYSVPQVFA